MDRWNHTRCHLMARWFALGVATFFGMAAHGADVRFGGILPGGGVIHKQIVSLREARFKDMVPQRTDFSCGAAAVATILKYAYGKDTDEEQVMRGMLQVSDPESVRNKGFSLLDIKTYAETQGLQGHGYKINQAALEKIKVPVILLLDLKGYKHFVVFKKAVDDKVYVADPALGNKVMDMERFMESWNEMVFALVGQGLDENSVLLAPAEPLSAKKLLTIHAPIPDVNLIDFGFEHASRFRF